MHGAPAQLYNLVMLALALTLLLASDGGDAPVTCKTWRDCSYDDSRPPKPVSSKQVKRRINRPVRPCKDAEKDAVCDQETKTCKVIAWKC